MTPCIICDQMYDPPDLIDVGAGLLMCPTCHGQANSSPHADLVDGPPCEYDVPLHVVLDRLRIGNSTTYAVVIDKDGGRP